MHPGVEDGDGVAGDLFGRALLRAKSVQHVVLGLDAEHIHSGLVVLSDQVDGVSGHLLLLFITLSRLLHLIVLESPDARVAQEWTQVGLNRAHEILMIEAHNLINEVLDQDANHPDLLVSHSATLSLIHAITA